MKPLKFKEQNKTYAEHQKEYLPLPVYEDDLQGGRIFSCWGLSLKERIKILFTGKLWINILNFKRPPQPIRPSVDTPFEENIEDRIAKQEFNIAISIIFLVIVVILTVIMRRTSG